MSEEFVRPGNALPTLFDLLVLQRGSSIFFDYLRESSTISQRMNDESAKSTLLLPTNKAVIALGWKPHQGPPTPSPDGDVKVEITEEMGKANVERWLSAHILPADDIDFKSENPIPTLLEGRPVSVLKTHTGQSEEWQNYGLAQGDGAVGLVKRIQASNGVLYVINGTISSE
ncbi:hypothetical protein FRC04_007427 [Tulasnella sp. 424]|nr:hypothetical protein FRC04_007427 [Tulasnella sp. 424]KAG8975122.1 hypothetical protein FRC05_006290 [Tulasnella sp. 425]